MTYPAGPAPRRAWHARTLSRSRIRPVDRSLAEWRAAAEQIAAVFSSARGEARPREPRGSGGLFGDLRNPGRPERVFRSIGSGRSPCLPVGECPAWEGGRLRQALLLGVVSNPGLGEAVEVATDAPKHSRPLEPIGETSLDGHRFVALSIDHPGIPFPHPLPGLGVAKTDPRERLAAHILVIDGPIRRAYDRIKPLRHVPGVDIGDGEGTGAFARDRLRLPIHLRGRERFNQPLQHLALIHEKPPARGPTEPLFGIEQMFSLDCSRILELWEDPFSTPTASVGAGCASVVLAPSVAVSRATPRASPLPTLQPATGAAAR